MTEMSKETIQILSAIVSRAVLAAKLGYQYGTSRDLYEALGYPTTLTAKDFASQYARQDIAQAVINKPVDATWRGGFDLIETDDDQETPFEKAWEDLNKSLGLMSKFSRLDKLIGLGTYGVLLLGFDDVANQEMFADPVKSGGKRKLLFARPLSEDSAQVSEWEQDTKNPRYGQPTIYSVTLAVPGVGSSITIKVHHSRVIHVADMLLESDTEGTSRLEPVFNRLMDIEKISGGDAEMFWRGARPGYHGNLDKDYTLTQTAKDTLQDQIDEYEHNLRRLLITEGIDFKELAMQIADPSGHMDIQLQLVSAQTGIPKRILTGSERGELSSTQDRDTWFGVIDNRRTVFAEPCIVRPTVSKFIETGVLPSPKDDYSVMWAPLYEESDKDRAEVGRIRATALKEYTTNPQAEEIVPPAAFFEFFLGMDQDEIELIAEMKEAEMMDEQHSHEGENAIEGQREVGSPSGNHDND